MGKRWRQRPAGATWGDFGEDDQLGRLNLLTPDVIRRAAMEIREGLAFCLSLPLDFPGGSVLNPRRHPPRLSPTLQDGCPCFNYPLERLNKHGDDILSDDQVTLALQYSTQWDAFAHIGAYFDVNGDGHEEKVYYNGYRANESIVGPFDYQNGKAIPIDGPYGAHALDIANFARKPIQGRGVLIDLKRHLGPQRQLVGYAQIDAILRADGINLLTGDIVMFRTGFAEVLREMNRNPDIEILNRTGAVLDGRDHQLLQWITDSGIAALCADNYAVEGLPAREASGRRPSLPLHQHCLFKLGVPLAELWWLKELADWLAAQRRSCCFLTAPPLYLPGAVGSPVTPVATV